VKEPVRGVKTSGELFFGELISAETSTASIQEVGHGCSIFPITARSRTKGSNHAASCERSRITGIRL